MVGPYNCHKAGLNQVVGAVLRRMGKVNRFVTGSLNPELGAKLLHPMCCITLAEEMTLSLTWLATSEEHMIQA